MNRDKVAARSIKNKQAQAREEYAKNKPLLMESKLEEKENLESFNVSKSNTASEKEEDNAK